MRRHAAAASAVALVAAATLAAVPPQTQAPVFRGQVQTIQVDVRVTDRDGNVVRDLTARDFTILEDRVLQEVTSATFVDLEVESPVMRMMPGGVDSDVASNAGVGRMWVLLLGGIGERARVAARTFVQEALGPNDQVAVLSIHGSMSAAQGFTRSRPRLIAAIDRLEDTPTNPTGNTIRTAYDVLEEVCDRLGRMVGRKAVIYFDPPGSFGVAGPPQLDSSGRAVLTSDATNYLDQREAIAAATRNNVAIYVVSTVGIRGADLDAPGASALTELAGQRLLAEDTGGDFIVNTNNYLVGYQRFVRDSNQYYVLGYTPRVEHRDGDFHELTVRVNRPGLTVRARRGYYAPAPVRERPRPRPRTDEPTPAGPKGLSAAALDALRMPLSVSGLTVDIFAAPFRPAEGRSASVLLGAQVRGDSLELGRGEEVELGFVGTNTEGKMSPGRFHIIRLDLSDTSRGVVQSSGLPFVDRLQLAPGRHQVKFVAHQRSGKTGMVVADIDVPNFSRSPIETSGLVLAADPPLPQIVAKRDDPLLRMLGSAYPTARRSFSRRERLTVYVEVYTNGNTRVSDTVAGITRVGRPGGRPLSMTRILEQPQRAAYRQQFPLRDLEAADYVLMFEARAGRQISVRRVPFSVTEP